MDGEGIEQGEYCAAVADADMVADLDRQWQTVHLSLQKAEKIALEKEKSELKIRQVKGMENFHDRDLETRLVEEGKKAHEALKALSSGRIEALTKQLEKTQQRIQATRPPPGVAASRAAAGGGGGGLSLIHI